MLTEITAPLEEWREIPDFEGRYSVSNEGRVRSHLKCRGTAERILKPYPVRDGYLKVDFGGRRKEIRRTFYVARLVLLAFLGEDPDKQYVNHKNGVHDDNRLKNLEWCTQSENLVHSYRVLGRKPIDGKRGTQNVMAKLTDEKVIKFRAMRTSGTGIREITRLSGLDRRTIQKMLRGESWKHIPHTQVPLPTSNCCSTPPPVG